MRLAAGPAQVAFEAKRKCAERKIGYLDRK
jgi:hypothetical protein